MLLGTWSRKMNHSAMPRQTSRRRSRPSSFNSSGAPTHKFIMSGSSQFQFGSVYPGNLFCNKKHCLDRPAVTIVCFGQQYLDECLALAHALGFSSLFDFHGLTENVDQHGRQIALAFTTTARIAGLTLAELTFDWRMLVSNLAANCIWLATRLNILAGHC